MNGEISPARVHLLFLLFCYKTDPSLSICLHVQSQEFEYEWEQ